MNDDLIRALGAIVGGEHVIAPGPQMAPYLEERRGLFQGHALAVAQPGTTAETARLVKYCRDRKLPMVPQGGNTGLCGGAVPDGGVVISLSRLNEIRRLDPVNGTITVEAGVILQAIQEAAQEIDALFPLSLAAEGSCQIGGNIATNAGGTAVLRYGNIRELVLGLEVVLADGRIWDGLRGLRKDNTGYDLKQLFIGAEGTLGIITAAVLKLFPAQRARATAFMGCSNPDALMKFFERARAQCGDLLSSFEMIARQGLEFVLTHIPETREPMEKKHAYNALIELTSPRAADALRDILIDVLGAAIDDGVIEDAVLAESEAQGQAFWKLRESLPEAQRRAGASIKHDVAVPISQVAAFLEQGLKLVSRELPGVRPCPFGHMGDGNIHFNLSQPEGASPEGFLAHWERMNRLVHDLVVSMGGSFAAEHGLGRLKVAGAERYKSDVELDLMRSVKRALDPDNLMNPGKVIR